MKTMLYMLGFIQREHRSRVSYEKEEEKGYCLLVPYRNKYASQCLSR